MNLNFILDLSMRLVCLFYYNFKIFLSQYIFIYLNEFYIYLNNRNLYIQIMTYPIVLH